jgi:hypothetical protein
MVSGAPGTNQFRLDPAMATTLGYGEPDAAGVLRFAAPLAGSSVRAKYFVGEWEVTTSRYRGELLIDVIAASVDAVNTLSNAVAAALRPGAAPGFGIAYVLTPTTWGPIGLPEASLANGRRRTLTFRFDVELESAVIPTGGGVIGRVDVGVYFKPPPEPPVETFSVT